MNSLLTASKWSIFVLPVLGAKGCSGGGGGGGGSPSPSSGISDWLSSNLMAYLPSGAVDALHQVPLINWLA